MYDDAWDWNKEWAKRGAKAREVSTAGKAVIHIPAKLRDAVMVWVNQAKGEVGGLGKLRVFHVQDREFHCAVETVELLEQDVTPGNTGLHPKAVEAWLEKSFGKEWRTVQPRPDVFWWHSHVDFGVFFSAQDELAIDGLSGMNGVVGSVCFNKKDQTAARVDVNFPELRLPLGMKAEVLIHYPQMLSDKEVAALELDFVKKVREDVKDHVFLNNEKSRLKEQAKRDDRIGKAARAALKVMAKEDKKPKYIAHTGYRSWQSEQAWCKCGVKLIGDAEFKHDMCWKCMAAAKADDITPVVEKEQLCAVCRGVVLKTAEELESYVCHECAVNEVC